MHVHNVTRCTVPALLDDMLMHTCHVCVHCNINTCRIAEAARCGLSLQGTSIYVTMPPCKVAWCRDDGVLYCACFQTKFSDCPDNVFYILICHYTCRTAISSWLLQV